MKSVTTGKNLHAAHIKRALRTVRFSGKPISGKRLIILAFFNRSGSNLLAEYLRSAPDLHGFREQLNHTVVIGRCAELEIDHFPDYITRLAQEKPTPGFGLKASGGQIRMLADWNILAMFEQVQVLHIQRRDIISQAVSFWIARHTLQWKSSQTAIMDERAIPYDVRVMSDIAEVILQQNRLITSVCSEFALPVKPVVYEDLVAEPQDEMRSILRFLKVESNLWVPPAQTEHHRQESEIKRAFVQKMREDMRRLGKDPLLYRAAREMP